MLILDDFLLHTLTDEREVKVLFELLEKRCEGPLPPLSDRWHRTSGRWAPQNMCIAVETAELPLRPHQLPLPTAECSLQKV